MQAVEASLKRLQTDHIDLYYIHRVDPDTAWEQTIAAFGDLIRQGKIREWGLSNVRAWHIPHVVHLCRQLGVPPPTALQPYYNLMNRQPEVELLPAAKAFGLGVVPYSPIARGVLTGKYKVNQKADPATRAGRQDRRMMEVGVAPREPDDRREAEGARGEARHHAGGLGGGLGAQQPRHYRDHRRPAHLRAVDRATSRALDYTWTAEDEKLADGLVTPGHASTPAFNDPQYPVEGRFAAVGGVRRQPWGSRSRIASASASASGRTQYREALTLPICIPAPERGSAQSRRPLVAARSLTRSLARPPSIPCRALHGRVAQR